MHPSTVRFEQVVQEVLELHRKKSADYGRTHDPFANIRASEEFGVPAHVGCAIRMNDKMRRIQAAANGSTLQNESLKDSFLDLAVYAIIGLVLLEEGEQNA